MRAPPLFALQPHGPPRMHAQAQLTVGSSVRPRAGAGAAVIPLYATGGRGTVGVTTSLSQLTMAHLPPGSALYWCAPGRHARLGRARDTELPHAAKAQGAGRPAQLLRASRAEGDGRPTSSCTTRVREHARGSGRARRAAPSQPCAGPGAQDPVGVRVPGPGVRLLAAPLLLPGAPHPAVSAGASPSPCAL